MPGRGRRIRSLSLFIVVAALASVVAVPAAAQWGVASSLYTQDGVEVAVDARLFSVFAMLNGHGFDRDEELGPPPLFRPRFSASREEARSRLGRPGPSMEGFKKLIDRFQVDPSEYARAALHVGAAPRFEVGKGAPELARALSAPLKGWYNEEGGAASFRNVARLATEKQKRMLDPLDKLCRQLASSVRLGSEEDQILDDSGPSGRVVVILNELDAHSTLLREQIGDVTYIVTGPRRTKEDDRTVLYAAGVAFARTLVSREVEKHAKPGTLADTYAQLSPKAKKALPDANAYLTELFACGMLHQVDKSAACEGSPLEGEEAIQPVVAALNARLKAYVADTTLLPEAMPALLAPLAPAADAAPSGAAPPAAAGQGATGAKAPSH